MSKAPVIGIDLGTFNSCVAVFQNGKVDIIPNEFGERTTPSYVSFVNNEIMIGNAAKNRVNSNPTNTIYSTKRIIGRKFSDNKLQEDLFLWPFKIIKDLYSERPKYQITYQNQEKQLYAEEIIVRIFQKMKNSASAFLGKEVRDAVVTVPNYFNDLQRKCIKDAVTISGLNVLRTVNETSAAALAYGFNNKNKNDQNLLIFELGGGNLNVSVVSTEDGLYEVKSLNGNIIKNILLSLDNLLLPI